MNGRRLSGNADAGVPYEPCAACRGTGEWADERKCPSCGGTGEVPVAASTSKYEDETAHPLQRRDPAAAKRLDAMSSDACPHCGVIGARFCSDEDCPYRG